MTPVTAIRTYYSPCPASAARRRRSSLFAEHAAPGLIELFAGRADDLDVELSVHNPATFSTLLLTRAADVAIGPRPALVDASLVVQPFLNYRIVVVTSPRRGGGIAVAVSSAVSQEIANGSLKRLPGPALQADGVWSTLALTELTESGTPSATAELTRFVTTPRATQAMLRGAGVTVGRFRPSIHVTLWK